MKSILLCAVDFFSCLSVIKAEVECLVYLAHNGEEGHIAVDGFYVHQAHTATTLTVGKSGQFVNVRTKLNIVQFNDSRHRHIVRVGMYIGYPMVVLSGDIFSQSLSL